MALLKTLIFEEWKEMIYQISSTVSKNQEIASAIYQMKLKCPKIAAEAKPGQFIKLKCREGTFFWRPFSITSVEKDFVYLVYQVIGQGTEWLSHLKKGNVVDIQGPLGNGFSLNPEIKNPILVAGGTGFAPLIFLAKLLVALKHTKPLFLIGLKEKSSIIWLPLKFKKGRFGIATEDGSEGLKGTVTELLEKVLSQEKNLDSTMIYAAGPRRMLKEVAHISERYNIPCEVSLENIMACGVGACLGCTVPTTSGNQRVCKDGPVFNAKDIVWDKYVPIQKIPDIKISQPLVKHFAEKEVSLAMDIGNIKIKNPVMPASGTFGYGEEYADLINLNTLGAIITKGITLEPRNGADQPRICETAGGMINRIGLQNPGVEKFITEKMPFLQKLGIPVIVNICGGTIGEYIQLAKMLDEIKGIAGLEINISCPNTEKGGMLFGQNPDLAFEVVSAVRKATSLPLITKLTPAVTSIVEIAKAAVEAGINALSAINTIPALGFVNGQIILGGQSGPGIKNIALRFVYDLAKAKLGVPIIACGGIMTWQDMIEFLMVGAKAVEIGTATFRNPKTMEEVIQGIRNYLEQEGIEDINDIIGMALN